LTTQDLKSSGFPEG